MHLISLDKKLFRVEHKLSQTDVENIKTQHVLTTEQIEEQIRREIYSKFMQGIAKNIPTIVENDDEYLTYKVSGYVLSERQMLETILEILQIDDSDKLIMIDKIKKSLGIFS